MKKKTSKRIRDKIYSLHLEVIDLNERIIKVIANELRISECSDEDIEKYYRWHCAYNKSNRIMLDFLGCDLVGDSSKVEIIEYNLVTLGNIREYVTVCMKNYEGNRNDFDEEYELLDDLDKELKADLDLYDRTD